MVRSGPCRPQQLHGLAEMRLNRPAPSAIRRTPAVASHTGPMNSSTPGRRPPANELGVLLRHWRDLRGKSQFDLSLDTGVSQRHISFIEIGRSVPSRQMLIDIATALDIPLRDRNTLLLAGGYAPIYPDGAWDGPEMHC